MMFDWNQHLVYKTHDFPIGQGDTHFLQENLQLPEGDLLIHGGDLSVSAEHISQKWCLPRCG